jgi:hypothetical protein
VDIDTFDKLVAELSASMKRLRPALRVCDSEAEAAALVTDAVLPTRNRILARSNRLAKDGVASFVPFTKYERLERHAMALDRPRGEARTDEAQERWRAAWSGDAADRAVTVCRYLQRLESAAPKREKSKRNTTPLNKRELQLRDSALRAALKEQLRDGPLHHTALHALALAHHKRMARDGERPPTREYISNHPAYRAASSAHPSIKASPITSGASRREKEAAMVNQIAQRAFEAKLFPTLAAAREMCETDRDEVVRSLAGLKAEEVPPKWAPCAEVGSGLPKR